MEEENIKQGKRQMRAGRQVVMCMMEKGSYTLYIKSGINHQGFPGGTVAENPPANEETQETQGTRFYPWVRKIP